MKSAAQFREQAVFLRESSGSTNIEKTLLKALKVLKLFDIPHYVCGGFAVQEHGYPRFTVDVDIIVPDVEFAREKLADRDTEVEVNILPGGAKVDPGPLTLPMPVTVSEEPQILTLDKLISSKLSTYLGRGIVRAQDYADVVQLVQVNQLPREYSVNPEVRELYQQIWDGLHANRS